MDLTRLPRFFTTYAPTVSLEIAADRVTGVSLGRRSKGKGAGVVVQALPAGVVTPALNSTNIADTDKLDEVVRQVLSRLPGTPTRIALAVPDCAAKVSFMTFEQIPSRADELEQLVRWQAKKTAPFRIEDAQVAYAGGIPIETGGQEFVVSLMRRDIVQEYETTCTRAGAHAGIVDLSSFSLINAILAGGVSHGGDWLLVHLASGYSSIAVVRQGALVLFRSRTADATEGLANLVHQTRMYYEDRVKGDGFAGAYLVVGTEAISTEHAAELRRSVEASLGIPFEAIELSVGNAVTGSDAGLTDLVAASFGLLLRDRELLAATR